VKVAVVFEPDPELGPDPLDDAETPRRLGEFLDSERVDILLIWREYGNQFDDGFRTHIVPSGVWENVTSDQVDDVIARLGDLS
jgi:hypothetical protein